MARRLPWLLPGIRRPNFNLHRISIRMPKQIPRSLIYVLIYGIVFYIFGGGAYMVVNQDVLISIGQFGNSPLFIARSIHTQYLIEGLVIGFILVFAAVSLYLLDHATKFAFDVGTAQKVELIGTILVVVWYIAVLLIFRAKLLVG